jgi:DNA-binding response OmpR family regulator
MKASILVVDDQVAIALSTQKKLTAQGFDVDIATSGEEALTRIEQNKYDIVILDIMMPIMNGIQVLEFITAKHPYSDVMMMTAFEDYSMATECMEKGAKDYLLKPLDYTELVSRIHALLRVRDSEHRYTDLRNFWQSTVLFDVFGPLKSIQFTLNEAVESLESVLPAKDIALLSYARALNDQIARILKESVNDFAVRERSHRSADCEPLKNARENDLAEGIFLQRRTEIDLGLLLKGIAGRYELCALKKGLLFQQSSDSQLPLVKCDARRVEQVVNSILEIGIETSHQGDLIDVVLSKSQSGLHGEPHEYVICTIEYPKRAAASQENFTVMTEENNDWKNLANNITDNNLALIICRKIIEGQRGMFQAEVGEDSRMRIKFALPLD